MAESVPVCPMQIVVLANAKVGVAFTVTVAVFVTTQPPGIVAFIV